MSYTNKRNIKSIGDFVLNFKKAIIAMIVLTIIIIISGCELKPELQDKDTLISTIESEIPNTKLTSLQESEDGCERIYTFNTGDFEFQYHDVYSYTQNIGIYNGFNQSKCNYFNSLLVHVSQDIYAIAEKYKIQILHGNEIEKIKNLKENKTLVISIEEDYVYRFYVSSSEQIHTMFDFLKACTQILDKYVPTHGSKLCIESDVNISIRYFIPYKGTQSKPKYDDSIIDCLVPFSKEGFKNMNTYEQIAAESYEKAITNGYLKDQIKLP